MTKTTKARIESLKKYLADVSKGVDTVKAFNDHKERMQEFQEIQALGWDSIEQYEEAQRFYANEKAHAAAMVVS